MTYCVGIKVDDGLVFAADTRTSASVDDVRCYNKLHAFELPGRVIIVMAAGNLATTQAVLAQVRKDLEHESSLSLLGVPTLYDAAEYLGALSVRVQKQARAQAPDSPVEFESTLILGGQVRGAPPGLYLVYPEGNCISCSPETPYLQIGELKYGKPILDRVIHPDTSLDDAARCALVSLDATMRSNISVGPPLDLAVVPDGALRIARKVRFDASSEYFAQLGQAWSRNLLEAFRSLPPFEWEAPRMPARAPRRRRRNGRPVESPGPH